MEPAGAVIDAFALFWPEASLNSLLPGQEVALSWWLPGLCAAADWVGSNTEWFAAEGGRPDLGAYLAEARRKAETAVQAAGLAGSAARPGPLFDFALRPMQAACAELPLPPGPMVAVIEAVIENRTD